MSIQRQQNSFDTTFGSVSDVITTTSELDELEITRRPARAKTTQSET